MRKRRAKRKFYTKDQRLQHRVERMLRRAKPSSWRFGPGLSGDELLAGLIGAPESASKD